MPGAPRRNPRKTIRLAPGVSVACIVLALIFGLVLGWPAIFAAIEVTGGLVSASETPARAFFGPGTATMLLRTVVAAAIVSAFATIIAYPIAWALRSSRALIPFVVLPIFMPSYVAYAGWGVLRGPQTALGRWIASGSIDQSDLRVRWAYDIQAVLGLSLWAWPIAAIIIAAGLRRLSPDTLEALRLEAVSSWRRWMELVVMTRSAIIWAFGVIFVLMLGSAVPFHVAQLETYAIAIWRLIDLTGPEDRWRVWVAALPLVGATFGVGVVLAFRSFSISDGAPSSDSSSLVRRPTRSNGVVCVHVGVVWILSVLVPTILLATTLRRASSISQFFRENGAKIFDSLGTALTVGCLAWAISIAIWFVARRSRSGRITAMVCVASSILIAPVPGLLIGLATSRAWNALPAFHFVADTSLIVVFVHVARFAFIPALVGWWLAQTENKSLFDLSRVDGAETFLGWFRACYLTNAWPTVAGACAVAMLSFQEIEASIMVVPAGYGSMSGWMLQQLHYLRQDELAAGVLFMLVPALGAASVLSLYLLFSRRRENLSVVSSGRGT